MQRLESVAMMPAGGQIKRQLFCTVAAFLLHWMVGWINDVTDHRAPLLALANFWQSPDLPPAPAAP